MNSAYKIGMIHVPSHSFRFILNDDGSIHQDSYLNAAAQAVKLAKLPRRTFKFQIDETKAHLPFVSMVWRSYRAAAAVKFPWILEGSFNDNPDLAMEVIEAFENGDLEVTRETCQLKDIHNGVYPSFDPWDSRLWYPEVKDFFLPKPMDARFLAFAQTVKKLVNGSGK